MNGIDRWVKVLSLSEIGVWGWTEKRSRAAITSDESFGDACPLVSGNER